MSVYSPNKFITCKVTEITLFPVDFFFLNTGKGVCIPKAKQFYISFLFNFFFFGFFLLFSLSHFG